jgi:hypothetical protein
VYANVRHVHFRYLGLLRTLTVPSYWLTDELPESGEHDVRRAVNRFDGHVDQLAGRNALLYRRAFPMGREHLQEVE